MDTSIFVVFVILVAKGVHGNDNHFTCYGDPCNRGNADQFCSSTFRYCRDCAAVVDSCGTKEQPLNCTSFCTDHLAALRLNAERVANCQNIPNVTNGNVTARNGTENVTSYQQGNVLEITCDPGFRLESTGLVHCGPFGEFRYESPTCKAIRCKRPPLVLNGNILEDSASDVYTVGHNVSYECSSGYTLHGTKTMTCTVDGVWVSSDYSTGYSLLCLKDRPNGWMYGCIAIIVLVIVLFLLVCIRTIRKHKRKNTTTMSALLINMLCKWQGKWIYSSVSTGTERRRRNISTSSTTECKQTGALGRNQFLTEAAHDKKSETFGVADEKQPCEPFYRNTQRPFLTETAILDEKTSGQGERANGVVNSVKPAVYSGTVPVSMKSDPGKSATPTPCSGETVTAVQPESATRRVKRCGCVCYCNQSSQDYDNNLKCS